MSNAFPCSTVMSDLKFCVGLGLLHRACCPTAIRESPRRMDPRLHIGAPDPAANEIYRSPVMNNLHTPHPFNSNPFVSSDMAALASHMNDCQRSNGPFLRIRSALEWLYAHSSARIVTTGALLGAAGLCLLVGLS